MWALDEHRVVGEGFTTMNEPRTRADVIRDLRTLLADAHSVFFPDDSESEEEDLSAEEKEAVYQMALDDIRHQERSDIREALHMVLKESDTLAAITDPSERGTMGRIVVMAARVLTDLDGLAVAKT